MRALDFGPGEAGEASKIEAKLAEGLPEDASPLAVRPVFKEWSFGDL